MFTLFIRHLSMYLFSFSESCTEKLSLLLSLIKKQCKSVYKVEILDKQHENTETVLNFNEQNHISSSVFRNNTRFSFENIKKTKKHQITFSNPDFVEINNKKKTKFLKNTNFKISTQNLNSQISARRNLSQNCLEIMPSEYRFEGKYQKITKKFEDFRNSITKVLQKMEKYKKPKNDPKTEFLVKNRKKLFSSNFGLRLIFKSWQNYIINKKSKV